MCGCSLVGEKSLAWIGDDLHSVVSKSRIRFVDVEWLAQRPHAQDECSVVLVSANIDAGRDVHERVQQIRRCAPHASVYLVSQGTVLPRGRLAALAYTGVDDFFAIAGAASRALLVGVIKHRLLAPPPVRAIRKLSCAPVPAQIAPLVRWTIVNSYRRPSIEAAADAFSTTRRTIARRLERHEYPRYSELRRLGTVLHILDLHTRHGLSMNRAAHRVGFANASIVSKMRGRWTNPTVDREGAGDWIWTLGRLYDAATAAALNAAEVYYPL